MLHRYQKLDYSPVQNKLGQTEHNRKQGVNCNISTYLKENKISF